VRVKTLSDGVNVHVYPTDKFKSVSAAILIRRPISRRAATVTALSPQILRRGSRKHDTFININRKIESLFGATFDARVVKKGEQQIIQFFTEFSKSHDRENVTFECLEFLNDMAFDPLVENGAFLERYARREKENLRLTIEGLVNNKTEYAKQRCIEIMCSKEPFGVRGDGYAEDLDDITSKNAYEYYLSLIKRAEIDFVVIGDVDAEKIFSAINGLFPIERDGAKLDETEVNDADEGLTKEITENMGLTQGKICAGFRTAPSDENYYGLLVANEIYGGQNSRLFNVVREKHSLCYYINTVSYRSKGIILLQSGVDAGNFDKALELSLAELENLTKNGVSDEELENAKNIIDKMYLGVKDSPGYLMDFYVSQFMMGDSDGLDEAISKIENVSKRDAERAFANLRLDAVYKLS
jgi:predicted Zn-dependent peptidase